jgi:glycosyltransferase involved in cell wall biosynthesis
MKWACFVAPHIGGTYTVYASLRQGFLGHGVELRWLGLGEAAGVVLSDEAQLGRAMVEHILARGYDGVLVNVLASRVQTNAIRHLPRHVRRIMIVHNITPATYAAAAAMRDWVDATVGVSRRIRDDLVGRLGFPANRTRWIDNAIDLVEYAGLERASERPLRLLSLGRIEDAAKGVLWLPGIMAGVAGQDARLTVAGDGPDLARLRERCAHLGERVRFLGRVAPAEVPRVMARHDVLLLPSRYEGFGQTLVEAMAAGCVPVASRIRGVTDVTIEDGESGLLFPVGDVGAAAAAIARLAGDRALLAWLAANARARAALFNRERQTEAYAALIREVMSRPPTTPEPLPFSHWAYPRGLRPGLRTYLPEPVKNLLRTWKERLAA